MLTRKLISFLRAPFWLQAGVLPVWCLLGLARAVILCIPFRRIAPLLGHKSGVAPVSLVPEIRQRLRARQVARLVAVAASYTPWISNCFPQAIVSRLLLWLLGVPCVVFFGVCRQDGEMKAHAWVMSGPVAVSGGHSFAQFTVVGVFASSVLEVS